MKKSILEKSQDEVVKKELYMLIGLPGSGKSHWAAAQKGVEVISTDQIRKIYFGDENYQGANNEVFEKAFTEVNDFLKRDGDQRVIFDATNVNSKRRIHAIKTMSHGVEGLKVVGVVFATLYNDCVKNDLDRERTVGAKVIQKFWKRWQTPHLNEGFDEIEIVHPYSDNMEKIEKYLINFSDKMANFNQHNEHHSLSLVGHSEKAYEELNKVTDNPSLLKAAILHDCGKVYTQTFFDSNGFITESAHYYGHENVSAYESMFWGIYFRTYYKNILHISFLINNHMRPYLKGKNANSKFKKRFGEKVWADLLLLHDADKAAH